MNRTDQMNQSTMFDDVKGVVATVLGIEDRAAAIGRSTELLGGMSEFDSMAVVEVIAALEDRFGITVSGDEVNAEIFVTLGHLSDFVADKLT